MRRLIGLVLVLLVLLVGCSDPGPGPVDGTPEAEELVVMRPTLTAVPGDGGNYVELFIDGTRVYDSGEGGPTAVPSPTVTGLPSPGPTLTAVATIVADDCASHDTAVWHEPGCGHQHGPPITAVTEPQIVDWLENDPFGQYFTVIGGFDPTSPSENCYGEAGCKHLGHKRIVENGLYDQTGPGVLAGDLCIDSAYLLVHSMGTAAAFRSPGSVHSLAVVATIDNDCDPDTPLPEDSVVAVATHGFYGERHSRYKETFCGIEPVYPENQTLNQPPYVTVNTNDRDWMFWSTLTNPLMQRFFEPDVNRFFQVSWSEQVWETPGEFNCTDPAFDVAFCPEDGLCGANGTRFQIHTLLFNLGQFADEEERPYVGYVDRYQAKVSGCTGVGEDCFPIYIGKGVGCCRAMASRKVRVGTDTFAPFLDYARDFPMPMPGYSDPVSPTRTPGPNVTPSPGPTATLPVPTPLPPVGENLLFNSDFSAGFEDWFADCTVCWRLSHKLPPPPANLPPNFTAGECDQDWGDPDHTRTIGWETGTDGRLWQEVYPAGDHTTVRLTLNEVQHHGENEAELRLFGLSAEGIWVELWARLEFGDDVPTNGPDNRNDWYENGYEVDVAGESYQGYRVEIYCRVTECLLENAQCGWKFTNVALEVE